MYICYDMIKFVACNLRNITREENMEVIGFLCSFFFVYPVAPNDYNL